MKRTTSLLVAALLIAGIAASNSTARPAWMGWAPENGVAIRQGNAVGWNNAIATRDSGDRAYESAVVWEDTRSGCRTLALQIIEPDGAFRFATDGILVLPADRFRSEPSIAEGPDGSWFIAWIDRAADSPREIRVTKLNPMGQVLWGIQSGGLLAEVGGYYSRPQVVGDGEGGCFVTVNDLSMMNARISVIHFTSDGCGDANWPGAGLQVSSEGTRSLFPKIASDEANGMIMIWSQQREGSSDLVSQHISFAGELLWNNGNPRALSTHTVPAYDYTLVNDGAGGAFAAWGETLRPNGDLDIYAQRVDALGNEMWDHGGEPIAVSGNEEQHPKLILEREGVAVIVWEADHQNHPRVELRAMMIAGERRLERLWRPDNGVKIIESQANGGKFDASVNGTGGVFIVWPNCRLVNDFEINDIYAQNLLVNGDFGWPVRGVQVCAGETDNKLPVAAPNALGGLMAVWWSGSYENCTGLSTEIVNADGRLQLGQPISVVRGVPGECFNEKFVVTRDDEFAVAWMESGVLGAKPMVKFYRNNGDRAECLNGDGTAMVEPNRMRPACTYGITPDGEGGIVAVWQTSDDVQSYLQAGRYNPHREIGWPVEGMPVTSGMPRISETTELGDGMGGVFVAWVDQKLPDFIEVPYIQYLNADGDRMWGPEGMRLDNTNINCRDLALVSDGEFGVVVMWREMEERDNGCFDRMMMNRFDDNGRRLWGDENLIVADGPHDFYCSKLVKHPAGYSVSWTYQWHDDLRATSAGIRTQFISQAGELKLPADGLVVVEQSRYRMLTSSVVDALGRIWLAWQDNRAEEVGRESEIYVQAIDLGNGDVADPGILFAEGGMPVSHASARQNHGKLAADARGGVWLTWYAHDGGPETDIYATHLNREGVPARAWGRDGRVVSGQVFCQLDPEIAMLRQDGASGAVVVWLDGRSSDEKFYGVVKNVYCQRIDDQEMDLSVGRSEPVSGSVSFTRVSPNPFNGLAQVEFLLDRESTVELQVFDLAGRIVSRIEPVAIAAGRHSFRLSGEAWGSGTYLIRLEANGIGVNRKVTLIK